MRFTPKNSKSEIGQIMWDRGSSILILSYVLLFEIIAREPDFEQRHISTTI